MAPKIVDRERFKLHVRKNDQVVIIAGTDKSKRGRVLRVVPKKRKVVVEGVHFVVKHQRRTAQSTEHGRIQKEAPIDISNVLLYCPKCDRGVRTSYKHTADGTRVRVCKRCNEEIG